MHTLRSTLLRLLKENNLTPTELSRETDIPRTTIQMILSGTTDNPRLDTLLKLAKYFKLPVRSLIGQEDTDGPYLKNTSLVPILQWEDVPSLFNKGSNKQIEEIGYVPSEGNGEESLPQKSFGLKIEHSNLFDIPKDSIIVISTDKALLLENDLVLVSKDSTTPFIRKVHKEGGNLFLISDINGMQPLKESEEVKIIGKIIKYIKKV